MKAAVAVAVVVVVLRGGLGMGVEQAPPNVSKPLGRLYEREVDEL